MKLERYNHLVEAVKRWKVDVEKGEIYTRKGLCTTVDMRGYGRIGSKIKGKYVAFGIHEVIAYCAGMDLLGDNKQVNHINGIKTDNRVENLEVVTIQENVIHSFKTGLNKPRKLEEHSMTKLTNDDVIKIRKMIKEGKTQRSIARMYGVSNSTINHIKSGRNWSELKEEN